MTEEDLKIVKKAMRDFPLMFDDDIGERKIDDLTINDFDFQGYLIPNLTLKRCVTKRPM